MGGAGDSIQTRVLTMGGDIRNPEQDNTRRDSHLTVMLQTGNQVEAEMAAEPLLLFSVQ